MAAIDQIVQVQISQQTQAVPQAGFGIPLIIGTSNRIGSDYIRYYSSTAGMLTDGFLTSDPEYIYAQKAFSQALSPELVGIGKRTGGAMATDLQNIINQNNLWYGLVLTDNSDADILAAAAFIETVKKIMVVASSDAAIPTNSGVDLASQLKGFGYKRSALMYSATQASLGMDAAWVGGLLPTVPGSVTWKFKQLVGISPDTFTDTARTYCIGVPGVPGKNVNIYETVGGVNITEEGTMAGGQFIDQTIGIDWLESTLQTNVFSNLVNLPKVPYTDQGVSVIEAAVRAALLEGIKNDLIDGASPFTVTAPLVLDVPVNDRAERLLPDVKFSCRLAGALHFVQINGVVTV